MYEPDKTKDKDGINIRYHSHHGGAGLRDAVDELMAKCGVPTGTARSTFVRQLLAELLLPGHGNRIVSQLDLSNLNLPSETVDSEIQLSLDAVHSTLKELTRLVRLNRNDVSSLAINALVEYDGMDPDQATELVRQALGLNDEVITS